MAASSRPNHAVAPPADDKLPLTVAIIALDAAAQIGPCLASVAGLADEMLVVDSGSRDATAQVARDHGARVETHEWLGFGRQKQLAVSMARNDWVLCLDVDERVSDRLAASIRAALAGPRYRAYRMARRNRFLGRWLAHGEGYPDWNVRLFDRRRARWTEDAVHEHVVADGPVVRLRGDLLHASAESIEAYVAKQNRYTSLQAAAMHARGEGASLARIVLAPLARFLRFYVLKRGFLDGTAGFAHIAIGAFASFLKYAKLRALK